MKKIYVLLLLTATIVPTSCMELRQRHKKNTEVKHQEKKPFLDSITTIKPNDALMKKLYSEAYSIIALYDLCKSDIPNDERLLKSLTFLITNMNNTKETGITEDLMGSFSYNKSYTYTHIPLIFGCLKRYRLTASKINEPLPLDNNDKKQAIPIMSNSLTRALGLETTNQQYLTYNDLTHGLSSLLQTDEKDVSALTCCLYKNAKTLFNSYSSGSYTDLNNEFYNKAYSLLIEALPYEAYRHKVYDLLQMIDKAKMLHHINQEKELGHNMLNFKSTGIFSYLRSKEAVTNITNRISLFCILVEKYNKARGDKITPTNEHYKHYKLQKMINLALPDSFDNILFNENHYAFIEFETLIHTTSILVSSDDKNVQQCIDQLYPPRK